MLTPVGNQTVFAGNTLTFNVGATDVDGDTPIFVSTSLPSGATLSAAGVFSWPAANPVGNYTLNYFARDNDANSTPGTVNIAVIAGGGGGGDTTPPGSPASLTASPISSGGQVTLNWPAATDNVGVTAYQVERCQGVGCTNFALINTVIGTTGPAALTFDAAGNGAPADNVSSLTWSHTVGTGSNQYLLVCLANRDNNATPVKATSVTYRGTPLTRIRTDNATVADSFVTELWGLPAPTTGTGNIVATLSGGVVWTAGASISVSGVDQAAPIDAQGGANSTTDSANLAVTITTVAANAWLADCAAGGGNAGLTVGAGQTVRANQLDPNALDGAGMSTVNGKATPGAEVMDWTQSPAHRWAISAVSLKPAP